MLMTVHMLQRIHIRFTFLRDRNASISSQKVSGIWIRESLLEDVQLLNRQHIL